MFSDGWFMRRNNEIHPANAKTKKVYSLSSIIFTCFILTRVTRVAGAYTRCSLVVKLPMTQVKRLLENNSVGKCMVKENLQTTQKWFRWRCAPRKPSCYEVTNQLTNIFQLPYIMLFPHELWILCHFVFCSLSDI